MKREIRFRGINIDTDKWVYGYYAKHQNKDIIVNDVFEDNGYDFVFNFIKSDSLGELTGLQDKNGVDIYEGDIVKWGMHKNSEECWHRYAVTEINPDIKFRIIFYVDAKTNDKKSGDNYSFSYGRFAYKDTENHLEVIGNIQENPELLAVPTAVL